MTNGTFYDPSVSWERCVYYLSVHMDGEGTFLFDYNFPSLLLSPVPPQVHNVEKFPYFLFILQYPILYCHPNM